MGDQLECCRRPQGLGKRDLKTYKGPQKRKVSGAKAPNFDDDDDDFGIPNPPIKKNLDKEPNAREGNPSSYLDSIYAENKKDYLTKENFPNFNNIDIEPVNEPNFSNQGMFQPIQAQENYSQPQPQYENGQYFQSYAPQQNNISQPEYMIPVKTNIPYIQPQGEFHSEINNYNTTTTTLPTKYVTSEPPKYDFSQNDYSNTQSNNYINAQNTRPVEYAEIKPISYVKNAQKPPAPKIQAVKYLPPKIHKTKYTTTSVSNNVQYSDDNNYSNYESQPVSYTNYESNPESFNKYESQPETFTKYEKYEKYEVTPESYNNYENYESHQKTYTEYETTPKIDDTHPATYTQYEGGSSETYETPHTNNYTKYEYQNNYVESQPQSTTEYVPSKVSKVEVEYKPQNTSNHYIESSSTAVQYIKTKPKQELQIEYIEPEKQVQIEYKKQVKQNVESMPKDKSPNDSKSKEVPKKAKKVYMSKPKKEEKKEQKEKSIKPQPQIEKTSFAVQPKKKEEKKKLSQTQLSQSIPPEEAIPEIQQEPEDIDLSEAEPRPYKHSESEENSINIRQKNMKKRQKPQKYIESDENSEKERSFYDEIKSRKIKKYNKKMREEERDFSPDGYKKFYPPNDPFFKRPKGKKTHKVYYDKENDEDSESNRAIYDGEMMNGKRHGIGKLKTKEYIREGTWKNDEFTGWGRESRPNGEILEGRFINGKLEGKGILRNSEGSSYIGDFVGSKRDGYGELETEKAYYRGEFKNDKFHGRGKIKLKEDDSEFEGIFRNGEIEKENTNVLCGGKVSRGAKVEKIRETTACQAPGFITDFFSKIFS